MSLALFIVLLALPLVQLVALIMGWNRGGRWLIGTIVGLGLELGTFLAYEATVSDEANIRVDLLFIYPALLLAFLIGVTGAVRWRIRRD